MASWAQARDANNCCRFDFRHNNSRRNPENTAREMTTVTQELYLKFSQIVTSKGIRTSLVKMDCGDAAL